MMFTKVFLRGAGSKELRLERFNKIQDIKKSEIASRQP